MGRSIPIELATISFTKKSDARLYFKDILNRYKPGERVSEGDSLHVAALLERHHEYAKKVGCGIDHFEVMLAEQGTQCFRIVRIDGTGTDFSYGTCIDGQPPSRKQEVSQAFRRAVRFDIYRARDAFVAKHKSQDGLIECGLTGEWISPDQGHLDHKPPQTFEVLVSLFVQARGLDYPDVPITDGKDDQVAPELTDEKLIEDFRRYHAKVAHLEFVKDKANLAQSAKHRVRAGRIRIADL